MKIPIGLTVRRRKNKSTQNIKKKHPENRSKNIDKRKTSTYIILLILTSGANHLQQYCTPCPTITNQIQFNNDRMSGKKHTIK